MMTQQWVSTKYDYRNDVVQTVQVRRPKWLTAVLDIILFFI